MRSSGPKRNRHSAPTSAVGLRWSRCSFIGTLALGKSILAGCADGYPTEDEAVSPAQMTEAQLVDAINDPGERSHLEREWHFHLRPGCALEVTVRNGGTQRHRLALDGASFEVRPDEAGKSQSVEARPKSNPGQPVLVFESRRWADGVRMRSLLSNLARRCTGSAAAPS